MSADARDEARELLVGLAEEARDAVLDELGQGAARRRDDRRAGGHGLGDDEAEGLVPGDREEERAARGS